MQDCCSIDIIGYRKDCTVKRGVQRGPNDIDREFLIPLVGIYEIAGCISAREIAITPNIPEQFQLQRAHKRIANPRLSQNHVKMALRAGQKFYEIVLSFRHHAIRLYVNGSNCGLPFRIFQ